MMRVVLTTGVVASACKIESGGQTFDFTTLSMKQLSWSNDQYSYAFTFCDVAACFNQSSSLCQTNLAFPEGWSLGDWSTAEWSRAGPDRLMASMKGAPCWQTNRQTNVTFECVDGEAKLLNVVETESCRYTASVQVPRAVCTPQISCCAPPTFSAMRMEVGGNIIVVQRDAVTGNWFDGDFEGRSQMLLCSSARNRCFTYTPDACVVSAYRSPPTDCYGQPDWDYYGESPLGGSPTKLTQWMSSDGNYVVTLPFSSSTCVPVSGSGIDSSFGVSLNVDPKWWDVPPMCVLALSK